MSVTKRTMPEIETATEELLEVRTCVQGSAAIKRNDNLLPHPSSIDKTSDAAKIRYAQYKAGAEFDEFTKTTLSTMLGKMQFEDATINLDPSVEYLKENCDGNGTTLKGLSESIASNILQVKWHVLVAEYKGAVKKSDDPSIADQISSNPHAEIKQYSRESVKFYLYGMVNGRKQLIYILFKEESKRLNMDTLDIEDVDTYLQLMLKDGNYVQQKITVKDGEEEKGEENPVTIKGKPLQFLPVEIVFDQERATGDIPCEAGFLGSVANLALYRYRVSADYKEALASLKPTLNVYGMNSAKWKTFKEINGRSVIANGSTMANVFDKDCRVELLESTQSLDQFEKFFDRNEKLVQAIGGVFQTDSSGDKTATQITGEERTHTSILKPITNNTEESIKRCIAFCMMFEGKAAQDKVFEVAGKIDFVLQRDFAVSKLPVEEVKELRENVIAGLISVPEYLDLLKNGGWLISDADKIAGDITEAPTILVKDKLTEV